MVGKCAPESQESPVNGNARRVIVEPESIAYVSTTGDDPALRPAVASLGATVGDRTRILLMFPRGDWGKDRVIKAYLLLDRAEGAQAGPGDVLVRAEKITEAWSLKGGASISWASPPQSEALLGAEARVASRGVGSIRIDVTPYASDLGNKNAHTYGLRIEAKGEGFGVPIATGVAGPAMGPRLEIYLQP